jgi:hypothetical protein
MNSEIYAFSHWNLTINILIAELKSEVSHCRSNEHLLLEFYESFKFRWIKQVTSKPNKDAKTNRGKLC